MQGSYNESLFGRDLTFRRPVSFRVRTSSQKECFAPLFADRSVFPAEQVHRQNASHHVAKARRDGVWYRYDDADREPLLPWKLLADSGEKAYLLAYEFDGEKAFAG